MEILISHHFMADEKDDSPAFGEDSTLFSDFIIVESVLSSTTNPLLSGLALSYGEDSTRYRGK